MPRPRAPMEPGRHDEGDFGPLFARARSTDPETSKRAAQRMNESGAVRGHVAQILASLTLSNGRTCTEIGEATGLGQIAVARRMKELEERGRIHRDGERDGQAVWWLGGKP